MQIRAGLKKEWLQFTRTFRLGGVLLATLSFALAEPLLLWGMQALLSLSANHGAGLELATLLEMTDIEGMSSAAFSSVMTELERHFYACYHACSHVTVRRRAEAARDDNSVLYGSGGV